MRTLILAAAGIATAATLTACGQATEHADAEPKQEHTFPSAAAIDEGSNFTQSEEAFLDDLEAEYPEFATAPNVRRQAVKAGHEVCDNLDAGMSYGELIDFYMAGDGSEADDLVATTLVASVSNLCTEYRAGLEAWANGGDVA